MHGEKWIVKPIRETREECVVRIGPWSHQRDTGNDERRMDDKSIRETSKMMREKCMEQPPIRRWLVNRLRRNICKPNRETSEMMRKEWGTNRWERHGKWWETSGGGWERQGKWWETNGEQIDQKDKENDERLVEDKSMRETRKMMREKWRINRSEGQGKWRETSRGQIDQRDKEHYEERMEEKSIR